MKKTGNLCIFALCAIFIGVALGCSDAGGGSDIEDGDNQGTKPPVIPTDPTKPTEPVIPTDPETGWQQPAYMNVTEEFVGQRFVEERAIWLHKDTKNDLFADANAAADQYINGKVAELQKLWREKNTGSALSNQVSTALDGFNQGKGIGQKIRNNYTTLAPVFVTMEDSLTEDVDYHRFKASYHKLAANAYKQSLDGYKDDITFPANREMLNLSENFFVEELELASLIYDEFTVDKAKTMMKNSLSTIANQTATNVDVLKKVVELALYNESLYGLNDYAQKTKVSNQNFTRERSFNTFDTNIISQRRNTISHSFDDRTM